VIHGDPQGETWFAVDQPSTRFGSFGDPRITAGGVVLDRKLAALLAYLDVPVPEALTAHDT
jgi:hypothetical protein